MKKTATVLLPLLLAAAVAPAQDWAKARLEKSPRHQEWVKVKHGAREVQSFIVYPEVKDKATAIVLIHLATNNRDIKAAFVFYGTGPDKEADLARINCPVYGFYGGDDARVTLTVPTSTELMKKAGKSYEPVTYAGAGHGFMRAGEEPNAKEGNKKARDQAWQRWMALLKAIH